MEESEILRLFESRDENALVQLTVKYGEIGHRIAANILGSTEDAEEVWNDALIGLWNTIPPERPQSLYAYLVVTVRNLAYDKCRAAKRKKRFGEQVRLALDELAECIPSQMNVEKELEVRQIVQAVNVFLSKQPQAVRVIFLQRYWAMLSVSDIAERYGLNRNTVKSTLRRTREKLQVYLEKEGYL